MNRVLGVSTDLAALLQRCASGDRAALRALYLAEAARLKGLALRITGSQALAEDVLQDVFVRLWQEAHRFDPGRGSARAWLTTLTRFRAMDLVRAQGRLRTMEDAPEQSDPGPTAFDHSMGHSLARRLALCLGGLPERQRQAITRAYLDGLTYAEVAAAQRMPVGTCKSLIRRSLRALRECMGE